MPAARRRARDDPMAWHINVRQFVLALALLQVAFGVRLVAAQWWQTRTEASDKKFAFGDSEGYWELARTIAQGEPYQYGDYRVFRTPGYPALLAPLFWLSGDREPPVLWGRVAGALFGTIAVGLVVLLAWKLFDERTAWIAGLIATFYPGQIASSVFVLSEAPFLPLMIAHLFAWQRAAESTVRSRWLLWGALGGVLCGAAILVRPSWLLFLPFTAGLTLLFARERFKHLQIASIMLLTLCLTMMPWWVRNYRVTGQFVPTSLQVGISLADGWNPEADGGSDLERASEQLGNPNWPAKNTLCIILGFDPANPKGPKLQAQDFGRAEALLDRHYATAAKHWALQNPGRVVQLAGIKFLRMWNFVPNASEFGSWKFRLLYALTYTPLLICFVLGLWKFRQRGFVVWLLFLPAVYFTLLHMIFVSSIRYQQPAMLAWLVLGAAWLANTKFLIPNPKQIPIPKAE